MKKDFYKKIVLGLLVAVICFASFSQISFAQSVPNVTAVNSQQSQSMNWLSCLSNGFTCAIYGTSYIINEFLNLGVLFGGVLLKFGLSLSSDLFKNSGIQKGFSIALALANLGFVLAIIVIAIATILRNETYGIKQALWKLIVMAILVNFGLVITAPIIGLSDNLTSYFLQSTNGADGFVNTLTTAFAPQALLNPPISSQTQGATPSPTCDILTGASAVAGTLCNLVHQYIGGDNTGAGDFTRQVMSLGFSAVFLGITALTFIAFGLLLLIRYVYLAILLIVLPLAWLTWIFPKFSEHFQKWWSEFLRWTFFPPLGLFFIYIAFQWVQVSSGHAYVPSAGLSATSNVGPELATALATGNPGLIQTGLQELLIAALCLGGLIAANKLSIKGSDTVMHGAKWVGGRVKGYAGKQTKKVGRLAYEKSGAQEAVTAMRRSAVGNQLRKLPIVGGVVGGAVGRVESIAGRAVSGAVGTNEGVVKDAQKGVPKDREAVLNNLKGSMNTETTLAHLLEAIKGGYLKADTNVNGKNAVDYLDSNSELLVRYGQGNLLNDANKIFMSDTNYRNARRAMTEGKTEVVVADEIKDEYGNTKFKEGQVAQVEELMTLSLKGILEKFAKNKSDASKIDSDSLFGPTTDPGKLKEMKLQLESIAEYAPQVVPNLVKKMRPTTVLNFRENYNIAIDKKILEYEEKIKVNPDDILARQTLAQMKEAKTSFNKGIWGNIFSHAEGDHNGSHEHEEKHEEKSGDEKH